MTETLREWRDKNRIKILEDNKVVLLEIRDGTTEKSCSHCGGEIEMPASSPKDRIEACKTLARQVSGLQPERVTAGDKKSVQRVALEDISDKDKDEIDALIHGEESWAEVIEE